MNKKQIIVVGVTGLFWIAYFALHFWLLRLSKQPVVYPEETISFGWKLIHIAIVMQASILPVTISGILLLYLLRDRKKK